VKIEITIVEQTVPRRRFPCSSLRADMKKGAYAKQAVRRSELQISSGTFVHIYHIVKHYTCQT
jgi:hypothetical protein